MTTKYKRVLVLLFILSLSFTMFPNPVSAAAYSTAKIHYIDVGQGDSVLIESNKKYMLIDTGRDSNTVTTYLKKMNVKKLEYLILTHPDADHIGGATKIIKTLTINKIIMPAKAHTSNTYEQVLKTIKSKNLKITKPKVGTSYTLGKSSFTIIAPSATYTDNNESSVGIRFVNGKNSFLFIGDAEETAITDIQKNKQTIKSNVLMIGHHGSETSTTKQFLKAVNPAVAIISVGKNSYGHPTKKVLNLLADANIDIYRTDTSGTIIATSTGTKITYSGKKYVQKTSSPSSNTSSKKSSIVYVTKTGKKYHLGNCSTLKSKIKITRTDALKKGYTACKVCNP